MEFELLCLSWHEEFSAVNQDLAKFIGLKCETFTLITFSTPIFLKLEGFYLTV
jgi:hypothetical protein